MMRVAINGFGRIGRLVLRALIESKRKDLAVVAINDLMDLESAAHLLRYDSVHGIFNADISCVNNKLIINSHEINFSSNRNVSDLPWAEYNVDIVAECTGLFTKRDKAQEHLTAGAKKVVISAPGTEVDATVVFGVNHNILTSNHDIISNASCTTNCLAPLVYVLHKTYGIQKGFMTTVHADTGDQPVVDTFHKDLYRARAAGLSIIPTSTGAAKAVTLVLPDLKGKIDGVAVRVPTNNVSMVDFTAVVNKKVDKDNINETFKKFANSELKSVLGYSDEKLVSVDFNHNSHSSIIAADSTFVIDDNLVRIMSWYDNEWGFANRMLDTMNCFSQFVK